MATIQLSQYRNIFRVGAFRRFWLGYTVSILGDGMTRVALTWFVFERTGSPQALGLFLLAEDLFHPVEDQLGGSRFQHHHWRWTRYHIIWKIGPVIKPISGK